MRLAAKCRQLDLPDDLSYYAYDTPEHRGIATYASNALLREQQACWQEWELMAPGCHLAQGEPWRSMPFERASKLSYCYIHSVETMPRLRKADQLTNALFSEEKGFKGIILHILLLGPLACWRCA